MSKRKVPHTFVIVFFIIVVAAVMTWFIRPGKYIDGTFFYEDQLPVEYQQDFHPEAQTWQVFSALFNGFVQQSKIIIFILMIGGAFWIMNKSRAIDMCPRSAGVRRRSSGPPVRRHRPPFPLSTSSFRWAVPPCRS
ncbi:MAG: hypothetical protein II662_00105 [Bacteroidales bacterium]|nr:hypothetical protein [Bacteroidales bacterium]